MCVRIYPSANKVSGQPYSPICTRLISIRKRVCQNPPRRATRAAKTNSIYKSLKTPRISTRARKRAKGMRNNAPVALGKRARTDGMEAGKGEGGQKNEWVSFKRHISTSPA